MILARKVMGRVRFMALREEIETDLAKGLFKKAVYAKYEDQLGFTYRQFLYYVREFNLGFKRSRLPAISASAVSGNDQSSAETPLRRPDPENMPGSQRKPINAGREKPKTFHFNPADIDRKKLI